MKKEFWDNTEGTWKRCNKPKRKPDYISYKRDFIYICNGENPQEELKKRGINSKYKHHFKEDNIQTRVYYEDKKLGISSRYWYGENKKGKYVIRESNHWGHVASCFWLLTKTNREKSNLKYGKIYLG